MSDPENSGPIPPTNPSDSARSEEQAAMNKTSSIPLKKETVRVTLKANPEAPRAETPNIEGAPPVAQASATPPPPPGAPRPGIASPAPTIRLKTAGGGVTGTPAPAPTVRLNTGPKIPGAPTVPLATRPMTPGTGAPTVPLPSRPTGAGAPTVPLQPRPVTAAPPVKGATMQLPKATVQITPTKPLGPPTVPGTAQIGTMHVVDDEENDRDQKEATTLAILSVVAFVASLVLLWAQIGTWTGPDTGNKQIGELIN